MFGVSDRLVQDSDTFMPRPSAAATFLNNELRSGIFMGKDQMERLKELVSHHKVGVLSTTQWYSPVMDRVLSPVHYRRLCCPSRPRACAPANPLLTGRMMVVLVVHTCLCDSRVASCVSGAVHIPTPEHAGTSEQQRQHPVHLVCQLLCSGEDGLPGRHGR